MRNNVLRAVLCVLPVACVVQGSTLFEDGFESYATNVSVNGLGGWVVLNEDADQSVTVQEVQSSFGTGSQSTFYRDGSANTSPLKLERNTSFITDDVTFSFDFRISNNQFQNPIFHLLDGGGAIPVQLNLQSTSEQLRYKDAVGWQDAGAVANATWYNVQIVISDVSAGTYDLIVTKEGEAEGGVASLTDLPFVTSVSNVTKLRFAISNTTAAQGTGIYIDNVSATDNSMPTTGDAILDDGFESYPTNSSLNGLGNWTVSDEDGTEATQGNQVVLVSSEEASPFSLGDQSIHYYDTSANTNAMWVEQDFYPLSSNVTVTFDFYMQYNLYQNPVMTLADDTGLNGVFLNLQSTPNDTFRYRDDSNVWNEVGPVVNRTWYRVEISIGGFGTDTFDLVLTKEDGTVIADLSGLPMQNSIDNVAKIGFGIANTTQDKSTVFYVDNVNISADLVALPADLTLSLGSESLSITSANLSPFATNTLQTTTDLVFGSWSNLSSSTGTSSNTWDLGMEDPARFYRILTE